jgi:hypothetical protein
MIVGQASILLDRPFEVRPAARTRRPPTNTTLHAPQPGPATTLHQLTCRRRKCKWIASAFSRLQLQCPKAKSPRASARHRLLLSRSPVRGTSGEHSHPPLPHVVRMAAVAGAGRWQEATALAATQQLVMNMNKSRRIMPAFLAYDCSRRLRGGSISRGGGCVGATAQGISWSYMTRETP